VGGFWGGSGGLGRFRGGCVRGGGAHSSGFGFVWGVTRGFRVGWGVEFDWVCGGVRGLFRVGTDPKGRGFLRSSSGDSPERGISLDL